MEELQIINDDTEAQDLAKLERQIKIARENPRDWDKMVAEVERRAGKNKEIAAECFYSLPKGGKKIEGPGVRFAELILASLDNIRIGTRIAEITATDITGECIIYDLQTNKQFNVRETKSIMHKKDGKMQRYTNDMVMTTGKAAAALAKRNCIFLAVPMVEFEETLKTVKKIATGALNPTGRGLQTHLTEMPLPIEERRTNALEFFDKQGVSGDRVLWALGVKEVEDIDEDALVALVGFRTSLKEKIVTLEELFGPTAKDEKKKRATGVTDDLKNK